ncbi:magnesium transporter CorA family protein [Aminipila luticellarii]|uniref:Cobalt transporter n=1 Tax=Aminipila luticellarii TaxID=2507160 RepID=A0A410PTF3_9FIRM|nr:CorA family divalent cation transporter [Aminipila luticellarii]QAT42251.1 hypothetical protein EQM06_02830 [Aminipila luticellarii]
MYYKIENDIMEKTSMEEWENKQDGVALFTSADWEQAVNIRASYLLEQSHDNIRFCKLESYADFLFGTLHIPRKRERNENIGFAFYIMENKLIFIDDTGLVQKNIERISSGKLRKGYTVERFLYDFLISLIEEDVLYLAEIEKDITKMEESILAKEVDDFNYRMLRLKKELSRMYRYYSQLTDLGEGLFDNEMDFFGKDDVATFRIYADRVTRLQSETQVLREYAMQVQEVYQSEIGIRQNDVMKVLTMVTTIFLPLSLIAGWYGMNFTHMPELTWIYGYPMVIALSIVIVLACLWLFKKKM